MHIRHTISYYEIIDEISILMIAARKVALRTHAPLHILLMHRLLHRLASAHVRTCVRMCVRMTGPIIYYIAHSLREEAYPVLLLLFGGVLSSHPGT